jgi:GxxExxY protein
MTIEHRKEPLIAEAESHACIGAFYSTYNELGAGFPEFISRRAVAIAIRDVGLEVHEEVELPVWFRGRQIAKFRADMIVAGKLLIEVKIAPEIDRFHMAQVLHYLKASDLEVGLLFNFGREPKFKRIAHGRARKRPRFDPPAAEDIDRLLREDVGTIT